MRKAYLLVSLWLTVASHTFAQQVNIDSLLQVLKTETVDTTRGNIYYALSMAYSSFEPQKALDYANQLIQLGEKISDKRLLCFGYEALANTKYDNGANIEAIDYFKKAIALRLEMNVPKYILNLANDYNNVAGLYHRMGNKNEAIKTYFDALRLYEKIGGKYGIAASYNNIGLIYYEIENYEEAKKYYQESLKVSESLNDKAGIANYHINMANVQGDQEDYEGALKSYSVAIKLSEELGDIDNLATIYANMGMMYKDMGKPKEVYSYYRKAIDLFERSENLTGVAQIYPLLIDGLLEQKKYAEAYQYSDKAIKLSKEVGYLEGLSYNYRLLAQLDSATGQFGKAYAHYKQYIEFRDSLTKSESNEKIIQQQLQYDFDKKEAAIKYEQQLTQEQLKQQKTLTTALIIGLVALLLAAALWYQRQKQKQLQKQAAIQAEFTQQLLQTTEDERGRIAIDLHDSISHELLSLKRGLKPEYTEGVAQKIDAIIDDIRQISRNLHPVLLDKIGLKLSIETLCEQYGEHETLFITHDIDYDKPLPKPAELQVFRIIQEALNNTVKYAQANASNITMLHNTEGIVLEIKDNGKGFDVQKALQSGKSFGLHSIIQRTKAIGGKAHIQSSESGTTITITIPNS